MFEIKEYYFTGSTNSWHSLPEDCWTFETKREAVSALKYLQESNPTERYSIFESEVA